MADPSPKSCLHPPRMLECPGAKERAGSKPGCSILSPERPQVSSRSTEKRLEEAKLYRNSRVWRSGRPTANVNLLFLDYLGSAPKSSLALPCLTPALPETLIFPAPSVWICLLPNLSNGLAPWWLSILITVINTLSKNKTKMVNQRLLAVFECLDAVLHMNAG